MATGAFTFHKPSRDEVEVAKEVKSAWQIYKDRTDLVNGILKFYLKLSIFVPSQALEMICDQANGMTNLAMSNMTASLREPWVIKGCKVDWISLVGCVPVPSISLVTHEKTVKLTMFSDQGAFGQSK